jgi:hypothetical protein
VWYEAVSAACAELLHRISDVFTQVIHTMFKVTNIAKSVILISAVLALTGCGVPLVPLN